MYNLDIFSEARKNLSGGVDMMYFNNLGGIAMESYAEFSEKGKASVLI
jgi:hypothetical protein